MLESCKHILHLSLSDVSFLTIRQWHIIMIRGAKEVWKSANIRCYTSAFQPSVQLPSEVEIDNMQSLMEDLKPNVADVKRLHYLLTNFIPDRDKLLLTLNEEISFLNVQHLNVNIAKVNITFSWC